MSFILFYKAAFLLIERVEVLSNSYVFVGVILILVVFKSVGCSSSSESEKPLLTFADEVALEAKKNLLKLSFLI